MQTGTNESGTHYTVNTKLPSGALITLSQLNNGDDYLEMFNEHNVIAWCPQYNSISIGELNISLDDLEPQAKEVVTLLCNALTTIFVDKQ